MQPVDCNGIIASFLGSLPTFIAVILAWLNTNARAKESAASLNKRIDDVNTRFNDTNLRFNDINTRFNETNAHFDRRFDDLKELIKAEFATLRAESKREPTIIQGR